MSLSNLQISGMFRSHFEGVAWKQNIRIHSILVQAARVRESGSMETVLLLAAALLTVMQDFAELHGHAQGAWKRRERKEVDGCLAIFGLLFRPPFFGFQGLHYARAKSLFLLPAHKSAQDEQVKKVKVAVSQRQTLVKRVDSAELGTHCYQQRNEGVRWTCGSCEACVSN